MNWVLLQSESSWQRNDASTFFIYLCVSLYQEFFEEIAAVRICHNCLHYGSLFQAFREWGAVRSKKESEKIKARAEER